MPGKGKHSDKWHSCWEKVQAQGHDESSAAAICTASLGEASYNQSHARSLHLVTAVGTIRSGQFEGRDHLVLPVVALVEGVIQAMNAPKPELVLAERFSIAPSGWNGRPIFLGHPMGNGRPISGNSPEVLSQSFGRIFNTSVSKDRLLMEAWLDPEKAESVGAKTVIDRANSGEMIEISTGAFIVLDPTGGEWNGIPYTAVWDIIIPDHLALLPDGATGACSVAMGCGTPRASHAYMVTAEGLTEVRRREEKPMAVPGKKEDKPPRTLRQKLSERLKTLLSATLSDVEVRNELREALKAKEPMVDWIEAVYSDRVIYSVYENAGQHYYSRAYSSDENDEFTVADTRMEVESIQTWEPVEPEPKTAKGARHSKTDQEKIQQMHDHSVDLGATCSGVKAASSSTCGCGLRAAAANTEGAGMKTKVERITALAAHPHSPIKSKAALEACSEEELKTLEESADAAKKTAEEAATKKAAEEAEKSKQTDAQGSGGGTGQSSQGGAAGASETTRGAAAPTPPTEEEWLKTAPPSIRDLVARSKAAEAVQKKELKTALVAAQKEYTEAELDAMSVDQLTRLARLANVPDTQTVDYSGRGFPRTAEENDVYRNPPDGYRMALEKRQKGSVN